MIVIRDASVLRAAGVERATVVVEGGQIRSVGVEPDGNGHRVIEAGGAWLGPGLVDLHAHLRDPGQTWKEDLESGAAAAAAGGFTAVVMMPNTEPPVDDARSASALADRAGGFGSVELMVAGSLTRGRKGTEMADLDGMYEAGVRLFTDDGDCVPEAGLLRRIMAYLGDLPGAIVAEHPEDRSVAGAGHMHEGRVSERLGIEGISALAEDLMVARDLEVAADTGTRVHLQHISTANAVGLIRLARERGVDVSAEVTPHHLALDEEAVAGLDPNMKMYPPLRSARDRGAVGEALREGTLDMVATDHAPHTAAEKGVPFEEAPRGVIGLETAAAAVASFALGDDQSLFFERMSVAPARLLGLERHGNLVEQGAPANLMLLDPERRWVPRSFRSGSENSPFTGKELRGKVLMTMKEGRITHEDGL